MTDSAGTRRPDPDSFRDPAGFTYHQDGVLHRQVNPSHRHHYDALMSTGLYQVLSDKGWLVAHQELQSAPGAYRTLRPQPVPYVSWPHEWCFSQLQDAGRLTLDIQQASLARGMTLKSANAAQIQFVGARPVLVDTLAFESRPDHAPWSAYEEFCRHFLAPLALISCRDERLLALGRTFIDGIPLDLASKLLPRATWIRRGIATHVHRLAAADDPADRTAGSQPSASSRRELDALIDDLRRAVDNCRMPETSTAAGEYRDATDFTDPVMAARAALVGQMIDAVTPPGGIVHDLSAGTGRFSRMAASANRYVVAHDFEHLAVERHYRHNRTEGIANVLPILQDLVNPSPALGWASTERRGSIDRMAGHTVMALALVPRLAITHRVPLGEIARFLASIASSLVVEFVPREDPEVRPLLGPGGGSFPDYSLEGFQEAFVPVFEVARRQPVAGSSRVLYALRRRAGDTPSHTV